MPSPRSTRLRFSARRRAAVTVTLALVSAGLLAGCGSTSDPTPAAAAASTSRAVALARAEAIQGAVRRWAGSKTLADAKAAAEQARNLVTGPSVAGAGDGDHDANVEAVRIGLLPGADGSRGLASSIATGCVQSDVLGGSWSHPIQRWDDVARRIRQWTPQNNTFPGLPSHAQRVVGWASLTLASGRLSDALEYSGHATGHARVVVAAITNPAANPCPGA